MKQRWKRRDARAPRPAPDDMRLADAVARLSPPGSRIGGKDVRVHLARLEEAEVTTFGELRGRLATLEDDAFCAGLAILRVTRSRTDAWLLIRLLTDGSRKEEGDRCELAKALRDIGGDRILQAARRHILCDPDPRVRYWMAYVLTGLFDQRAVPVLTRVVKETGEHPEIRAQAAEGLADAFECRLAKTARRPAYRKASHVLRTSLRDPSPEVRFWSAFALGKMRDQGAMPLLNHLAETDHAMCEGWWTVAEEAEDAMAIIERRPPCERTPSRVRLRDAEPRLSHCGHG